VGSGEGLYEASLFLKVNTAREAPAAVLLIYKKEKKQALYKQDSQIQGA
jgi:hypothetical protein